MQTLAVATLHDHWTEDDVSDHGVAALKLWARRFAKYHPIAIEILEWCVCAAMAVFVTAASLIANA